MADMDGYAFYRPDELVTVLAAIEADGEREVIAYGVPTSEPVPAAPHPLPVIAEDPDPAPLPMPKHTNGVGGKCLGCEWIGLRRRIRDAG